MENYQEPTIFVGDVEYMKDITDPWKIIVIEAKLTEGVSVEEWKWCKPAKMKGRKILMAVKSVLMKQLLNK